MIQKNSFVETTRDLISLLPVRRSQASNWMIRLLPIKKPFIGTLFGNPIEVHPMEAASRAAYFLGFYERETTIWCVDFLKKNKPQIVIDVGANFGYFSYLTKAHSPTTKVISFEADPFNFAWLQRNLNLIGDKNLLAEPIAISNSRGTAKLMASSPDNNLHLWSGIKLDESSLGKEIEVPAISIDEYCKEKKIASVDL
ncbi:MAG: FkbM family methyltransferase, partial [Bdellovibrionaceae bacterium]|nr:FkbM family methyltransferase [Pseudobdellovibrionaceae bacterium]